MLTGASAFNPHQQLIEMLIVLEEKMAEHTRAIGTHRQPSGISDLGFKILCLNLELEK
jgi:hypothetical protein